MNLPAWISTGAALLALFISALAASTSRRHLRRAQRHALQAAAHSARARRILDDAYTYDIDEDLRTDLRRLLTPPPSAPTPACPRCPRLHHPGHDCPDTCDASAPGAYGELTGPCILRRGHDGPVHKDADGCRWAPLHPTDGDTPVPYRLTGHQDQHP